ncbi:MAG TPA: nitroreductase family deazaflavin-dependent oxidoreductase [Pseudomonadales bacterium]
MTKRVELTLTNLLDGLAGEIRSPGGPGEVTRRFNETLIEEFRANAGVLSGELATSRFLLLTTTGARSGKRRTTPLAYIPVEGRILVIASKGGAATHPAWYPNLVAHPEVTVELGAETYQALAVVIEGAERDRLYAEVAARIPTFADYQRRTDRVIPVVELRRIQR